MKSNKASVLLAVQTDGARCPEFVPAVDLGESRYRLDAVPLYQMGISYQDIVEAHPNEQGTLTFARVLEKSGFRTLHAECRSDNFKQQIEKLGCLVQKAQHPWHRSAHDEYDGSYVAIAIPQSAKVREIAGLLNQWAQWWECSDPRRDNLSGTISSLLQNAPADASFDSSGTIAPESDPREAVEQRGYSRLGASFRPDPLVQLRLALLRNPLSEITRKERRTLLAVSALVIALRYSNLVPTQITALGITLSATQQASALLLLGAAVAYFCVAFSTYALSDFVKWRITYLETIRIVSLREMSPLSPFADDMWPRNLADHDFKRGVIREYHRLMSAAGYLSVTRIVFELIVPLVLGAIACVLAWL